ncbi:hypothetical protein NADFUDRAFT_81126 [Nadsonia fulvescens var. elongata DSM 6958]|uniref:Inactive metallocarboxypeptidase ECM14 n=1 Tax=Nadsonia fulvescens var. elongata DSM 6958 TaxID=857566 RepID=A0A1E3PRI9_9ASCO|nr:hypothetical protein NADFUDRAFT_81126 [Nadsonia fulvescens var. elongata DSM 6958]
MVRLTLFSRIFALLLLACVISPVVAKAGPIDARLRSRSSLSSIPSACSVEETTKGSETNSWSRLKQALNWNSFQIPILSSFSPLKVDDECSIGSLSSEHPSALDIDLLAQYEDQIVLRFIYQTPEDRAAFSKATNSLLLDVWANTQKMGDVRLPRNRINHLLKMLPKRMRSSDSYAELITDVQLAVHNTYPIDKNDDITLFSSLSAPKDDRDAFIASLGEIFFGDYRSLDAIYNWLDLLAEAFPTFVSVSSIGQTAEGRDIKVVHVHVVPDQKAKKTILVTGGIHAREWISVSSVCYSLYQLIVRYGRSNHITNYLDNLNFEFIPVMNPDGYVYSWESDRLWRKNRQQTGLPFCSGIDIDYSFDFQWSQSRGTPCSEAYAGTEPFQALEAFHLANFVNQTTDRLHGFLDWHAYSQEVLFPYSYSCESQPRDLENLQELAYGMAKAIRLTSGKHYDVFSACLDSENINPGGSALDYMYHKKAIWAFQVKLRDTGNYGFLLPRKYIIPTGKEMFSSVRYFCDFVLNPS